MNAVYVISKYVTVLGSVLKGFWEHLICRMLAIPVQDARYLQANELCGHVEHDFTNTKAKTFFLCFLPTAMNIIFGWEMVAAGFMGLFVLDVAPSVPVFGVYVALLYIGVSLLSNTAPLYEDALNNWDLLYGKGRKTNIFVKIFAFIPSVFFIVDAWLEKNGLNLLIYIVAIVLCIVL